MSGNMSFEEYMRRDATTLSGLVDKREVSVAKVAATARALMVAIQFVFRRPAMD
jgi:hypothetical protein